MTLFDIPGTIDPTEMGGPVGHAHPETSNNRHLPSGSQMLRVLGLLARGDATAHELCRFLPAMTPNNVGSRLLDLRNRALAVRVVDDRGVNVVRRTPTAGTGAVHRITAAGREELSTHGL